MLVKSWLSTVIKSNRILSDRTSRRLHRNNTASRLGSLQFEKLEDRRLLAVVTPVLGASDIVVFNSADAVADSVIFSVDDSGKLEHNLFGTGGYASNVDLDSVTAGDQTRMVSDITSLTYTDTGNNDSVEFSAGNSFDFDNAGFTAISVTARNILMNPGSSITTVDGNVTLKANQAATPTSGGFSGIVLNNAVVTSANGDIAITGQGGEGGGSNRGVYLLNGVVESTGTSKADAATININGTGGNGTSSNHGVFLQGSASTVSSVNGDITIVGQGGDGTENSNDGVRIDGGVVESTGTTDAATIAINGTGGDGDTDTGFHTGIHLVRDSTLSTQSGNVTLIGIGGTGFSSNALWSGRFG